MAFKFKLQAVLDHRRHLEELAMNVLAQTMRAQAQAEEQIRWLGKGAFPGPGRSAKHRY